jgi:hypothetical protein
MKTKKDEEIQDIDSRFVRTASITPEQEGNDEDLEEVEQRPGDEVELIKKRKGSPPKPSSWKKSKAPVTKMQTTLTPDDFSFLLTTMNEAIEEITEKQEAKQETMYNRIEIELQGVQQALQSSRAVSTAPLPEGTTEEGDEPVQLRKIVATVEVRLRKAQEETTQATQALNKHRRKSSSNAKLRSKRRMPSKRNLKKTEQRFKKRKNSCSRSRSGLKKKSTEHFAL